MTTENSWHTKNPFYRFDTKSNREAILKRINVDGEIYSYNQVKDSIDAWKKAFRDRNKSEVVEKAIGVDKAYERYCAELDAFLKFAC